MIFLTRQEKEEKGCYWCTEHRTDARSGRHYCTHIICPYEKAEVEWWKEVGGKALIPEGATK